MVASGRARGSLRRPPAPCEDPSDDHRAPVRRLPRRGVENLFETVFKGYHKRQVEDYIAWLQEQVSAAKAETTDARHELTVARDDLVSTREQLQARPAHEEISVRMAQILRLAEEEAQQERDQPATEPARRARAGAAEARSALEQAEQAAADHRRRRPSRVRRRVGRGALRGEPPGRDREAAGEATMSGRAGARPAGAGRRRPAQQPDHRAPAAAARRALAAHEDAVRGSAVAGVLGEVLVQDREQGDPAKGVDAFALPTAGQALDPGAVSSAAAAGRHARAPAAPGAESPADARPGRTACSRAHAGTRSRSGTGSGSQRAPPWHAPQRGRTSREPAQVRAGRRAGG